MWKEILQIVTLKTLSRDLINWALSYMLSQPIDIDVEIVFGFVLQFLGLAHLSLVFFKVKSLYLSFIHQPQNIEVTAA